jgi:integrase
MESLEKDIMKGIKIKKSVDKKNGKTYHYQFWRKQHTFDCPDGTQVTKRFQGQTRKEVLNLILEYSKSLKKGLSVEYKTNVLKDVMQEWLEETVKNEVRASTLDRYEKDFRLHIKEMKIADMTLNAIKGPALQKEFNEMFKEKGYSSSQISNIRKLLRKFFAYAVFNKWSLENPCVGVKPPKKVVVREKKSALDNQTIFPLSLEEMRKVFGSVDGMNTSSYMLPLLRLAFATGLRKGEILGLSYGNIDFKNKLIYVRDALKEQKFHREDGTSYYKLVLDLPKNQPSVRDVDMMDELVDFLKEYIEKEKLRYATANKIIDDNTLFFTTEAFNPINGRNLSRAWYRILARADLRQSIEDKEKGRQRFHNIRHTFATNLYASTRDSFYVSNQMGHESTRTTEKIYMHLIPQSRRDAINKMNWIFENGEEKSDKE